MPSLIEIDVERRRVRVDGRPVVLGGRAFDLLLVLAEAPGNTVGVDALTAAVWPGRPVSPSNLRTQINGLRQAMGREVVVNVPGRGYRLHGTVQRPQAGGPGLIGRADELRALTALAERARVVTVSGAGGIGKTRLVRAWYDLQAEAAGSTQRWIGLAAVRDTGSLLPLLATALDLRARTVEPWSTATLGAELAGRGRIVLVLDNAEALAVSLAGLLPALLRDAPDLRFVITSQVALHVVGEQVLRLTALECPDPRTPLAQARRQGAVALLVARAQAVQPGFVVDEGNLSTVGKLCRSFDGLPLALELAAARMATLGLAGVARALDKRLKRAASLEPAVAPRERTLHAALAWTHELLDAPARRLFTRLSVFAGPFTADDVVEVATDRALDSDGALRALQTLFDASLVARRDDHDPPRLLLPERARRFAQERLDIGGDAAALRMRHLEWCNRWLAIAPPERIHEGLGDLRSALVFALDEGAGASGAALAARFVAHPALAMLRMRSAAPASAPGNDARSDRLQTDALRAQAAEQGVGAPAFAALAGRIARDAGQPYDSAAAELARAVTLAAQVLAAHGAGAAPDDDGEMAHPELAQGALAAAALATREGLLDRATEHIDDALAEFELREVRRAATVRRTRLQLLDAALQQDLLRRDADGVVGRIESIIALDEAEAATSSEAWLAHEQHYLAEGRSRQAGLYFDIAAELARRRSLAARTPAERAAALCQRALSLLLQGRYRAGPETLQAAADAALAAEQAQPREADAPCWGYARQLRASALLELGRRRSEPGLLAEALACADEALSVLSVRALPDVWAAAQLARSGALLWQGARETGTQLLLQALEAADACLRACTPERDALAWVRARSHRGIVLSVLASREAGPERRRESAAYQRATLAQVSREQMPGPWAQLQNLLGIDLMQLAMLEDRGTNLRAAVLAFRATIDVVQREEATVQWANAQHNLGIVLAHLGDDEGDAAALQQALACYRLALEENTVERQPLAHAAGQHEVGTALLRLAALRPPGDAQALAWLQQGEAALRQALALRARDVVPLDWARSQADLAGVQLARAQRAGDRAAAHGALATAESVLGTITAADAPHEHGLAQAAANAARRWLEGAPAA